MSRQPEVHRAQIAKKSLAERAIDLLASVKFAVGVIVVITAACIAGTILPQGAEVAAYVQKNPSAADHMALFNTLGLTHVFSARWFIALLCVLATTVMVCSTRRLATVKRASGSAQRRALGSMLTHLSVLFILAGAVVRGIWGEKGWIELRQGERIAQFNGDKGARTLPFALQLTKFEIETDTPAAKPGEIHSEHSPTVVVQWTARALQAVIPAQAGTIKDVTPQGETPSPHNTFRIQILKYVPDFTVDTVTKEVTSRSSEPNNPAVLIAVNGPEYHNHRWVFARFPDFTMHEDGSAGTPSPLRLVYQHETASLRPQVRPAIKNFRSTVQLVDPGGAIGERTLAVNSPLKFKGYTFYQTGYNPDDLTWTSLEVVRDPGVPLVYAGFVLLIGGLSTIFYLNPWLSAREAKT
jgi:hypothetical protein